MRCDASRSKWLVSRSSMHYASRTNEPVWRIQTCRQESWASLSSPVPGIEPILCAKTNFQLRGPRIHQHMSTEQLGSLLKSPTPKIVSGGMAPIDLPPNEM